MNTNTDSFYFDRTTDARDSQSTRHYHSSYEVYLMTDGHCRYFIEDRSYDVRTGDVVMICPGVIHRTNYISQKHSRLLVNFDGSLLPPSIRGREFDLFYRDRRLTEQVKEQLLGIEKECELSDEKSMDAIRLRLGMIALLLHRARSGVDEEECCSVAQRAVKLLKEKYAQDLRLSTVADALGVSSEHLSRVFKKETGFGFNEYLTLLRLQKAEYMLKNEPGKTVSEIAYACGFNDGNYFSHKFRITYGIPPTRIRREGEKKI